MKNKLLGKIFKRKVKPDVVNEYYKELFIKNELWNTSCPNHEEEFRWKVIEKFVLFIKTKEPSELTILDLGCGRGWLTNLLSQYGIVTGIEPVKEVVDYANGLFPHLNIVSGTSDDLIQQSQKFDLVVASEVIEHIHDSQKQKFINNIYALLNRNGFVIISTPRKEAQREWMNYTNPGQPVEEWLNEETLKLLFLNNCFSVKLYDTFSVSPMENAPEIEIYQLWLFQKKNA